VGSTAAHLRPDSQVSASGQVGQISVRRSQSRWTLVSPSQARDLTTTVTFKVASLPTTRSGTLHAGLNLRQNAKGHAYRPLVRIKRKGTAYIEIRRFTGKSKAGTRLGKSIKLPFKVQASTSYRLQASVSGTRNVVIAAKVWKASSSEPRRWRVKASDSRKSRILKAGGIGIWAYAKSKGSASTVSFADLAPVVPAGGSGPSTGPGTRTDGDHVMLTPRDSVGRGAQLPVSYSLASLVGPVVYVSASGSDSGAGTVAAPVRTLPKAYAMLPSTGGTIVVRGGTYPITGNAVYLAKPNTTLIAYPGEIPTFDGSIAAPTTATTEGTLKAISYTPMKASLGEGLTFSNLQKATFSGTTPTGVAAKTGWLCVTSTTAYTTPTLTPTTTNPSGCASGTARVISGYFPDQVWVNGTPLTQVLSKSKVVPGTFWVNRTSTTDAAPTTTKLYLSATDATDLTKIRLSSSQGTFLTVKANKVTVSGIRIVRHSPAMNAYGILAAGTTTDFTVRHVEIDSIATIAIKMAGGSTVGGSQLVRRPVIDHVTAHRAGWSGIIMVQTDDASFTGVKVTKSNTDDAFVGAPQLGGLKAMRNARMKVSNSLFDGNHGPGVWWDESNHTVTLARSTITNNTQSGVFFEISHGLTMVDNKVQHTGSGSAVRLAGSSGLRLVNNTIVGGADNVAILTDTRGNKYDSNGDGTPDRYCSEHKFRYGQGGNHAADCNVFSTTQFDTVRPGQYAVAPATNLTPGLTWQPKLDLFVNNILANPTTTGTCGAALGLCITGYTSWSGQNAQISPNTIVHTATTINGNVYQTGPSGRVAKVHVTTNQSGGFTATTLTDLTGTNGFGSTYYGSKKVEANGRSAASGLVNPDGSPTPTLTNAHNQAAPVPTDTTINTYIPAGTRHYGALP
jgi:hypothetical protein